MSFFHLHILITPFVLFLPLYYVLLPFTNYDYSFCVIFAIVLCPSSVYKLWLLPLCYFCHCIMSFFRLHILITPFVLFLPLYYVLLPFTNYDYSFCVIFAIVLCPSSVYKLWLLLLCYFCHCIMSFFRLHILITPFDLFLLLQHLLLPDTDSDYSFCVIFAIVLCPSSAYRFWLLLLCYFCYCSISFFRIQILITPLCYFWHCIMSFFCLQILITLFELFLPLQHLLLPGTDSDYSFCVIFAIVLCPSSVYRSCLLLLCYFCHCIMSFVCLQILITLFELFLPLQHLLLPVTDSDYSFCVSFAIVLCPSSVSTFWLLLLCYFCHCIMSFFRFHILITPFVLVLPLYYVLLPFTHSDYSFCVMFAIVLCPSSAYRFRLLILCYFLPLYYLLLPITDSDYSFCVIYAIVLCPSSVYRFWLLLLCYFCHCSISFFRLQILISPFYFIFAIALCPSSVYKLWLLLLCYFCHCIMSFFRLHILITPFDLFLPLQHLLLPDTDSDYSFCVIFAIVLCPSSVYRFWLLLLCYFCHCSISFFRLQILITPFVLFLPLYYVLLPFTNDDYSFCVSFAIVLCPSSVYTFWLLLLTYFCHCSISFFRIQILITPFVLFLPLYYVLLLFTDSDYSFCVIFATAASPSSGYRFWLFLLCYFCHCIMFFFCLQIMITPFLLVLPLYYVLLPFPHSDYSFCVIFAIVLCPSSVYRFWLLLLCYFCHCIMSFFRLQIMITPFVLFLPLYYVLLPFTHSDYSFWLIFAIAASPSSDTYSDYSFCVIFAIVLCPSSVYRFWLLLLCYLCYCSISFFRIQILITPLCYFCHCIMSFFCLQILITELFLPLSIFFRVIIFAIVLCPSASPSSGYRFWLLLLCYFCHCITDLLCYYSFCVIVLCHSDYSFCVIVLLPFTNYDYSFCVIFAIVLCPSSVYKLWLLPLCYFCHCIMSFFRLHILITPFVLFLPLYYVLLPFTNYDYSFWLLLLCYFCHCSISFFRVQILITPFVLFLPLYYVLLLCTDPVYSFCVIFAIVLCPSSVYRFWLLFLSYFCHCSISFFRLQILITPFVLVLPLYYVLLPFPHSDYSFCVIFAIVLCPSSVSTFWLLLLC